MYLSHQEEIHCSFCRRSESQVKRLIKGSGVYVCNECIHQFRDLLQESLQQQHSACNCSQNIANQIEEN